MRKKDLEKLPVYDAHGVYRKAVNAVVGVASAMGLGSGFFIDSKGVAVTNRHVVGECEDVTIYTHNREVHRGFVIRSFPEYDIAFVKVDVDRNKYIKLSGANELMVGHAVYSIGYPVGISDVLTQGIYSRPEFIEIEGQYYMLHSAKIFKGSSGGPLLNKYARAVGINTWGITESDSNFAIPSYLISDLHDLLIKDENYPNFSYSVYCPACGAQSYDFLQCDECGAVFEV